MPWKKEDLVSLREEFVLMSLSNQVSFTELCTRYDVSRQTGYKWVARYKEKGRDGLANRSHRPFHSPDRTSERIEKRIVQLRQEIPDWGARKIHWRLEQENLEQLPSERTITHILNRHGLISPEASVVHHPYQRFEYEVPNALWQMDFKGSVPTLKGRSHPLTVLDDHSRFNVCLRALPNEQREGVQMALTTTFRRYGLPDAILADNGSPWGHTLEEPLTSLAVWLMKVGVEIKHSRPYHPQTVGKDERFHETLNRELLRHLQWRSNDHLQMALDPWRERYNCERPHEGIGMVVPASRYRPSQRTFPETLPEPSYPSQMAVRSVDAAGCISFKNREIRIGKALIGQRVGVAPTTTDGLFTVLFFHHTIMQFNLKFQ